MPMDAWREGDSFRIEFDLPGVQPDSIDLDVERNVLTVRAERPGRQENGTELIAAERPRGVFSRQLILGDNLDLDNVSANYRDGVLSLTVPVAEKAKPRKIAVESAGLAAHDRGLTSTQPKDPAGRSTSGCGRAFRLFWSTLVPCQMGPCAEKRTRKPPDPPRSWPCAEKRRPKPPDPLPFAALCGETDLERLSGWRGARAASLLHRSFRSPGGSAAWGPAAIP